MLTPEEIKALQEEVRVGNRLTAQLTDKCRELESQLAKKQGDCPACHGEKVVSCIVHNGIHYHDCPTCKGTGKADSPVRETLATFLQVHVADMHREVALSKANQIIALFDDVKKIKCFHCGEEGGTLVRLNPRHDIEKVVCMKCLWARHPKSALGILEFILDKEDEEGQALKDKK